MMQILTPIEALKQEKDVMVNYLRSKINSEDWHAVADAAMDLREIEAKIVIEKKYYTSPVLSVTEGQVAGTQAENPFNPFNQTDPRKRY